MEYNYCKSSTNSLCAYTPSAVFGPSGFRPKVVHRLSEATSVLHANTLKFTIKILVQSKRLSHVLQTLFIHIN